VSDKSAGSHDEIGDLWVERSLYTRTRYGQYSSNKAITVIQTRKKNVYFKHTGSAYETLKSPVRKQNILMPDPDEQHNPTTPSEGSTPPEQGEGVGHRPGESMPDAGHRPGESPEPPDWLDALKKVLREIAEQLPSDHYALEILYNEPDSGTPSDPHHPSSPDDSPPTEGRRSSLADASTIAKQAVEQGWQEGGETAVLRGTREMLAALLLERSVYRHLRRFIVRALTALHLVRATPSAPPHWQLLRSTPAGADVDPWLTAVGAMHDRTFPYAFYNGPELLGRLNEQRRIFAIVADDSTLRGYIYVEADPELDEGRIEFLAVARQDWSKGLGRALVTAAVRWLFSFPEINEITLLCENNNQRGLAFYHRLGFELLHVMRSFISPDEP